MILPPPLTLADLPKACARVLSDKDAPMEAASPDGDAIGKRHRRGGAAVIGD